MAKKKINLCLILIKCFFLCFVVLLVKGIETSSSDQSNPSNLNQNPNQNQNPSLNEADAPKLSLVLERLETLENKHQKLEKSHTELKDRFKSLKKEVEELRNENCVGEDVWLLTPPLRGRRGEKGEKGDSGIAAPKSGEKGETTRVQLPSPNQIPPEQKGQLGISAERSGKIPVGPSEVLPFQLSLQYQENPPDGRWRHICGAVILDEKTSITAAHCFDVTKNLRHYRVVAGEKLLNTSDEGEQLRSIQRIIIHPNYTNFRNGKDIALLHVEKLVMNEYTHGVWLSPFSNEKLSNLSGVVSGWGQVSNQGGYSNTLQKWDMSILSPAECLRRLQEFQLGPLEGVLCALNPVAHPCSGDGGVPLVIPQFTLGDSTGNLLLGIVSFSTNNCEEPNSPGFFTEISHFYDWIQENRASNPCEEHHLPCVSGGCYHEEWKCDEERDCPDGTDEMNCSKDNIY